MIDQTLAEKEIRSTLDSQAIAKLVSKYTWNLNAGRCEEVVKLFAQKTPGVRAEMLWGVYEGVEGIKRLYAGLYKSLMSKPQSKGQMFAIIGSDIDVIVAGDGKTAKGVSAFMGSETHAFLGKLNAYWMHGKYAIDFVKEDGVWKIWHFHVYGWFYTPFEKDWAGGNEFPTYPGVDKYPPDKPPTTGRVNSWVTNELVGPVPYETFDEKMAY